ncbi:hypothetical protein FF011L_38470 [Roseimaritima multifibrata]|uniref:Uncharacterized protein n=1 Tax=Roseimaritima multifibrata TaxID=1930274 RepID=A0A517MJK7_9BACT|nr:DUF4153 domain-containing protein [Roseimaritima multifibrata]QDS95063.1 hypothetical protein FF011L_38470 [Roseimaritima multifibrata]
MYKNPIRPLWERWEESPINFKEIAAVIAIVAVSDRLIYHSGGYSGYAVALAAIAILIAFGVYRPRFGIPTVACITILAMLILRLVWQGSGLAFWIGLGMIPAFVYALANFVPYTPDWLYYVGSLPLISYRRIACYLDGYYHGRQQTNPKRWLNLGLPLVVLILFGGIFILANPSLIEYVSNAATRFGNSLIDLLKNLSVAEILFCMMVGYLGFGSVRPRLVKPRPEITTLATAAEEQPSSLYVPFRNSLLTVVALFGVYLCFEFSTLWFRDFPEGFYYAGYAHRGAAWLTIALGLATVVLSFIFRGDTLLDPRRSLLRKLAWAWSLQNLLLALSVYNRMAIYIDFNGMTRMRTIGLFGITTVLVGFVFVLIKIIQERSFLWLLRRQLWVLSLAVVIYALLPVDWLVHRYNVKQVMAGEIAPAVQISVHPINNEGYLALFPLLNHDDEIVRNGIQAMLAKRYQFLQSQRQDSVHQTKWTAYQGAEVTLWNRLTAEQAVFQSYLDDQAAQDLAIKMFDQHVAEWY